MFKNELEYESLINYINDMMSKSEIVLRHLSFGFDINNLNFEINIKELGLDKDYPYIKRIERNNNRWIFYTTLMFLYDKYNRVFKNSFELIIVEDDVKLRSHTIPLWYYLNSRSNSLSNLYFITFNIDISGYTF